LDAAVAVALHDWKLDWMRMSPEYLAAMSSVSAALAAIKNFPDLKKTNRDPGSPNLADLH
jgi:hypothetical protein